MMDRQFFFRSPHVEIRLLTRFYNRVRKTTISSSITSRISFLIYILCKIKYMNYVQNLLSLNLSLMYIYPRFSM